MSTARSFRASKSYSRIALALLLAHALSAQDLPRGQVLDHVAVRDDDRQSYALYLPSTYSPDRA